MVAECSLLDQDMLLKDPHETPLDKEQVLPFTSD